MSERERKQSPENTLFFLGSRNRGAISTTNIPYLCTYHASKEVDNLIKGGLVDFFNLRSKFGSKFSFYTARSAGQNGCVNRPKFRYGWGGDA